MTDDLRYPIGKHLRQASYPPADLEGMIRTLEQFPAQFRAAFAGLSAAQLETPYREGGWTLRELAHHVPDSHMHAYLRFKLGLTEDNPTIKPYDEALTADLPDYRLPIEVSLALLEGIHSRWTVILRSLQPGDWARTYRHPENGLTRLDQGLALYDWHSRHHLGHAVGVRVRMGW